MPMSRGTYGGHVSRRAVAAGVALAPVLAAWPTAVIADPVDDVSMAGPLGDRWLGAPDAKSTFVEYAAVTCSHCAAFHNRTWPGIKARWVDTGRMRFALRGYLLSPLDTAGFMLALADGGRNYYAVTDLLFEKQASWAFVPRPLDAMRELMLQAGFDRRKFDAVLADQALYDHVNRVQARATDSLKITSTPTLFVDDTRHEGDLPGDAFDALVRERT